MFYYRTVSTTMEALPPLHEVGQVFSCCELCVENKRCHLIILVVTFVLMTFDMITDWINWIEWYGIGGYDQYFFASMFETVFLCVAAVGTGLWIMEVFLIVKKLINIRRESHGRKTSIDFYEYLPKPEVRKDYIPEIRTGLDRKAELNPRKYSEPEIRNDKEYMFEPDVKNYPKDEQEESSRTNIRNYNNSLSQQESGKCKELEIRDYTEPEVRLFNTFLPELKFLNYKESLFEPDVVSYQESLYDPKVINYKEPEVI